MSTLEEVIGNNYPGNESRLIARRLTGAKVVRILEEERNPEIKSRISLDGLLEQAETQAQYDYRFSRKTIPGVGPGMLQLTPDIPIPFTGRRTRQVAKQDLAWLSRVSRFVELARSGQTVTRRDLRQN